MVYLTVYSHSVAAVCFNIFDKDRSGFLDEVSLLSRPRHAHHHSSWPLVQREVIDLCHTVSGGTPLFPGNYIAAMQQFDVCVSTHRGRVDALLFPHFSLNAPKHDHIARSLHDETAS